MQPDNRTMPLDESRGIDILGNLMEASIISRNPGYYGDLHNMGHVAISYSHDPDNRHLVRSWSDSRGGFSRMLWLTLLIAS